MMDLIFPKQYIFSGTSGTGKTTTLEMLRNHPKFHTGYLFNTGNIRKLAEERGYKLNEEGTLESQREIFKMYYDWFYEHRNHSYVSDRSLVDVLAHTFYLVNNRGVDPDLFDYQNEAIHSMIQKGRLNHIFYFPINFEMTKDGVRSEDEMYRRQIDVYIHTFLESFKEAYPDNFDFTTIERGVPEDVMKQVLSIRV